MKKNLRYIYLFAAIRHRIELNRNVHFDKLINLHEYLDF